MLAEAAAGEETIVLAHGSLEAVLMAKARCDVGGHYSRPDVLQLVVHGQPLDPVIQREPMGASTDAVTSSPIVRPLRKAHGQDLDKADDHTSVR